MSTEPRWRVHPFPKVGYRIPDARCSIAVVMAKRAGFDHIPPAIWVDAGAIVRGLRADGFTVRRVKP